METNSVVAPDMVVGLLDDDFVDRHAGHFDVVTLWHVLEHVPEPAALLTMAARVIRPGTGVICVEVPNLKDELLGRSSAFHRRTFMMEHISYFSPETLSDVALRALPNADVSVTGYQRYGIFNYIHWIDQNAAQGAHPDMFPGTDRWWLETSWRAVREQTLTSDALYMTVRSS